jgi:hypothetical protein
VWDLKPFSQSAVLVKYAVMKPSLYVCILCYLGPAALADLARLAVVNYKCGGRCPDRGRDDLSGT